MNFSVEVLAKDTSDVAIVEDADSWVSLNKGG